MKKTMAKIERVNCKKCLMPFEERFINKHGECVICVEHQKKCFIVTMQKKKKNSGTSLLTTSKGIRITSTIRLLLFSGGKDSVYALYLVTRKYGMRPLWLLQTTDY